MPESSAFTVIDRCRSCGHTALELVIDFGQMPLSDGLVPSGFDRRTEDTFPLTVVHCGNCSLVQILETVEPTVLFGRDYPYYSSFSDALVEHSRKHVRSIISERHLHEGSLVVELASNDGYLLQWFVKEGIPVLGIDPAPGPARAAQERGVPTINEFFDAGLASRLVAEGVQADVIIGNNVLAHVPNQNDLVSAMETLLAPGGTIVMEFPYVRDLIELREFDTIYHEHHCYFSATAVHRLFRRHGLDLIEIDHLDIHGGSLRVRFERNGTATVGVEDYLQAEVEDGLLDHDYYRRFSQDVATIKSDLVHMIDGLIADGYSVAGYGAAAKGAILLNYFDIGPDRLAYVVDRNVHKHGKEMPGKSIPIHPVERLIVDPPDYLLILAWNFKDEIMVQQASFAANGGRFIIPIPSPEIL